MVILRLIAFILLAVGLMALGADLFAMKGADGFVFDMGAMKTVDDMVSLFGPEGLLASVPVLPGLPASLACGGLGIILAFISRDG